MKRCLLLGFLVLLPFASEAKEDRPQPKKPALEFNRDIRPILSDACFHCHGPDKAKRKGDLRLDTEEGGKSVVVLSLLGSVRSPFANPSLQAGH